MLSQYQTRLQSNLKRYYLASFFSGLIFIIPIWVAFERQFISYGQMASLESLAAFFILILELPTGALADLLGRRLTVSVGWVIKVIGALIQAFTPNAIFLFVGFIVASIGDAIVSGSDKALIYDSLKDLDREKDFKKVESKHSLLFQIGIVVATLAGGYLFKIWSGLPYFVYGLVQLVAAIIYFRMTEPKIDSEKFNLDSYFRQTKQGFQEIIKSPYVKKLSMFYVLVGGITWSTQYFYNQPFAVAVGFNEIEMSWLFGIIRLFNSLLLFRLTNIKDLVTKQRAFLLFPILMILTYLPGYWVGKWLAIPLLAGATLASTARFAILGQFTNEELASKNRATALSTLNMLVSLVYIIIVLGLGQVMETESPQLVYSILGMASLIIIFPLGLNLARNHSSFMADQQ